MIQMSLVVSTEISGASRKNTMFFSSQVPWKIEDLNCRQGPQSW